MLYMLKFLLLLAFLSSSIRTSGQVSFVLWRGGGGGGGGICLLEAFSPAPLEAF